METKCPTCGYLAKDSTVCPRCRTNLFDCFKCSGNCRTCAKTKIEQEKDTNK